MIRLNQVNKNYQTASQEINIIKSLDLEVKAGEFTAIVGPSGSGKTTLLNIIGCLDGVSRGSVIIDDINVTHFSTSQASSFRSQHLGFIFQDFNLIDSFSVYENIELPLSQLRDEKDVREKIETILEAIGIKDQIDKYPEQLSGGQKQRVAIARALVLEPKIILADEPTANLDSHSAKKVIEVMKEMQKKFNTTFIFSTHDTKIVDSARRIITLEDGQIISDEKVS